MKLALSTPRLASAAILAAAATTGVARILDRLDLSSRMAAASWYRTRFAG